MTHNKWTDEELYAALPKMPDEIRKAAASNGYDIIGEIFDIIWNRDETDPEILLSLARDIDALTGIYEDFVGPMVDKIQAWVEENYWPWSVVYIREGQNEAWALVDPDQIQRNEYWYDSREEAEHAASILNRHALKGGGNERQLP